MKWKEPYLIQRLNKPFKDPENRMAKIAEVFSFGGGYVRGGFTKEGWNLLKSIFTFDYMGSAEFEFGEVPKAFAAILDNRKDYISFEMTFKGKKYKEWVRPNKRKKLVDQPAREHQIYVFCHKDIKDSVEDFLKRLRKAEYGKGIRLKEGSLFKQVLFPEEDYDWKFKIERKIVTEVYLSYQMLQGWIDIDNYFMFFRDKEMYEQTKELFKIQ